MTLCLKYAEVPLAKYRGGPMMRISISLSLTLFPACFVTLASIDSGNIVLSKVNQSVFLIGPFPPVVLGHFQRLTVRAVGAMRRSDATEADMRRRHVCVLKPGTVYGVVKPEDRKRRRAIRRAHEEVYVRQRGEVAQGFQHGHVALDHNPWRLVTRNILRASNDEDLFVNNLNSNGSIIRVDKRVLKAFQRERPVGELDTARKNCR
mmetsp:Transcript_26144/g.60483  ORF Transcript_26144/g.60483 Transcript_26144/m.60483 type:complete len:206 (+) Transcript_26144:418-1035(+)